MRIKLNERECKLSAGREKIYRLLKDGYKIVVLNNYLIIKPDGTIHKEIKSNSAWTIQLMILDNMLVWHDPNTLILNPLITEVSKRKKNE